ncbi:MULTISPECIES: hypothetical protein [unclassified Paraburkholderia]|uniref:hypothetical protein n=1 Tax=unclassified Paraburkholderia TaxID=2615204 RepID=UPI002AAF2A9F|nr:MULTISPECIES: hypothetical protein [unclassified Paraburkholderia]
MRSYLELERDLSHIKAAISMLEQTRAYLSMWGPVADPAYWQARIRQLISEWRCDLILEREAVDLLGRLERFATLPSSGKP